MKYSTLFRYAHSFLPNKIRSAFYDAEFLHRLQANKFYPSHGSSFVTLKSLGFNPSLIIDIGAYVGDWSRQIQPIFPDSIYHMIEPQSSKKDCLSHLCQLYSNYRFSSALLGRSDSTEVFFHEMETGSSVYEEQSFVNRISTKKKLTRLDTLLFSFDQNCRPDLIKIDTQGYELEILEGAPNSLKYCSAVLLETSLIQTNKGCPLVGDIFSFMSSNNFILYDICDLIRRKDGVLWQADLLFIDPNKLTISNILDKSNWGL